MDKIKSHQLSLMAFLSGWQDSNLRPPGPKPGAITGLRYIPNDNSYSPRELLSCNPLISNCGESGIRTHGTV